MATTVQDNSGIDWSAYSNSNIGGVQFDPDSLLTDVVSDFDLKSSYKKKFEHYDPTGEEHIRSTAALQYETKNLEAGKAVYDLYVQNQQMRASTGFESAGVYDTDRSTKNLWDMYALGKKGTKLDVTKEIFDMRSKWIKDTFTQAVQLKQMQD